MLVLAQSAGEVRGLALSRPSTCLPVPGLKWSKIVTGKKRSPAYAYFVSKYRHARGAAANRFQLVCVHMGHNDLPAHVTQINNTTNLRPHLKCQHGL